MIIPFAGEGIEKLTVIDLIEGVNIRVVGAAGTENNRANKFYVNQQY